MAEIRPHGRLPWVAASTVLWAVSAAIFLLWVFVLSPLSKSGDLFEATVF